MVNGRRTEVSDVESEEADKYWWRQNKGSDMRESRRCDLVTTRIL